MKIIVTDAAQEKIAFQYKQSTNNIRVMAIDTYECSTMLEFKLAVDVQRENDEVYSFDNVNILLDEKARKEIGTYLKLDYYDKQGFRLINSNQTLAYGLRILNKS